MYKLIIIDDEELSREGLSYIVDWKSVGFEVVGTFEDGKDAKEYIDRHHIDVVLTDIEMSKMSGLELAREVYNNYPNIRIVLMSAYEKFSYAKEAISVGVEEYIIKPISSEKTTKLFQKLKIKMDKQRAHEALNPGETDESYTSLQQYFASDEYVYELKDHMYCIIDHICNMEEELAKEKLKHIIALVYSMEDQDMRLLKHILTDLYVSIGNRVFVEYKKAKLYQYGVVDAMGINKLNTVEEAVEYSVGAIEDIINAIRKHCIEQGASQKYRAVKIGKNYIKEHYDEEITLETMAKIVYLSPVYFSRIFKEVENKNFSDYLMNVRMEEAKKLLKDMTNKVYEISVMIGIKNVRYFYRVFKNYVGMSPTRYREVYKDKVMITDVKE